MVFAPEFDIAFFGGDPDNLEYPRYDLDVCFFRAYEDGKPAKVEHYLNGAPAGAKDGELVFVAGNPGRTDRLNTVASLEYLRDVELPLRLDMLLSREAFLLAYGRRSPEAQRHSKEELFSIQNSRKARVGGLEGLRTRCSWLARPAMKRSSGPACKAAGPNRRAPRKRGEKSPRPRKSRRESFIHTSTLSAAMRSIQILFTIARNLVRLAQEKAKPNSDRLKEFRDSALKSLELEVVLRVAHLSGL